MYSLGPGSNLPGHNVALHWPYIPPVYDQTPNDLFPDMTVSGTDLVIPIAALAAHGLTAANAEPSSGDPRQVLYAFLARGEEWLKDLSLKPEAVTVTPRFSSGTLTTGGESKLKTELKFMIYRDRPGGLVSDEP